MATNAVCLGRFHLPPLIPPTQCLPQQEGSLVKWTPFPLETCPTHQPDICLEAFSNITSHFINGYYPSTTTIGIILQRTVEILLAWCQVAISIPLKILLWLVASLICQLHQFAVDLLVHRKTESFLLLTCAFLVISLIRQRLGYWRVRGIPYECFAAHLNQFRPFSRWVPTDDAGRVRRLGRIFGSFRFTKPVLCISDLKMIEQVLYSQSDYFTGQNTWKIEGHLLFESVFTNSTPDIQRWKRKKAILMSSFLSRKLKLLKPTIDGLTEQLLSYVRGQLQLGSCKGKRTWQVDNLVFPWLVYSLLELIFDIEVPSYDDFAHNSTIVPALVASCSRLVKTSGRMNESSLLCAVPSLRKLVNMHLLEPRNLKQMQSVIDDAIRYRLDNGLLGLSACDKRPSKKSVKFRDEVYSSLIAAGKTDVLNADDSESANNRAQSPRAKLKELTFIDIILNYEIEPEDKLEGYDLSRQELLDNLTAFFTVSLSTLSETISCALFYLALYEAEQSKVRQEVLDCIGARCNINWESLRNLRYTEAFLKEVLRLNPPIERIERLCTKRCHLESSTGCEFQLSPGMPCTILVSAVQRDPEYYPEPDQFRPSRFTTDQPLESPGIEKPNSESGKFLAFGLGSRTCIGLKFVMFYLKHLIANILLEYELKMTLKNKKLYQNKPVSTKLIMASDIEILTLAK